MANKKETVTVTKTNGDEVVLDVVHPSGRVYQEAQTVYASAWRKAVAGGAILKDKLEDFLKENDLWDANKEKEKLHLFKELGDLDRKLAAGRMKVSEGRTLSLDMLHKRNNLRKLLEQRSNIEANTAESLAENQRFNYLVSQCVVSNKDGVKYFRDLEDYLERMSEPEAFTAATKLATMLYSLDDDPDAGRREIKFLKKYAFMNPAGQFIRHDGRLIDEEGRLLNDEGHYVNEAGQLTDIDGNRVTEEGAPVVGETEGEAEFIDDRNGDQVGNNDIFPAEVLASSNFDKDSSEVTKSPKKKDEKTVASEVVSDISKVPDGA